MTTPAHNDVSSFALMVSNTSPLLGLVSDSEESLSLGSGGELSSKPVITSSLPNNQAPALPAKPLPADSYKNNLLKAKVEEEVRADQKNTELSSAKEISSLIR